MEEKKNNRPSPSAGNATNQSMKININKTAKQATDQNAKPTAGLWILRDQLRPSRLASMPRNLLSIKLYRPGRCINKQLPTLALRPRKRPLRNPPIVRPSFLSPAPYSLSVSSLSSPGVLPHFCPRKLLKKLPSSRTTRRLLLLSSLPNQNIAALVIPVPFMNTTVITMS